MSSPTKAQREARKAAGLCEYCGDEPPVELPDGRILKYGEKCRAENREAKKRHEAKKKAEVASAGLNAPVPAPDALPAPVADETANPIAVEERGRQKMSRSKAEAFAAKKAAALAEGKCINCYKRPQADSVKPGREGKKIQSCAECRNKDRAKKGLDPFPVPEPVIMDKPPAVKEVSTTGRLNIKQLLIDQFGPKCFGCGASAVLPNGGIDEHFLTVDHIYPKKRANGIPGNDELYNSGLLCDPCNRIKNNRLTVEQLRAHNASKNRLRVPYEELQDMLAVLDWAVKKHETSAAGLAYQSVADFTQAKRGIDGGG